MFAKKTAMLESLLSSAILVTVVKGALGSVLISAKPVFGVETALRPIKFLA